MKLTDIASISGRGGLYRIITPTRSGVIVESLDAKRSRMVANANSKVSVLEEISVYTNDNEGASPLKSVFQKIKNEFEEDPGVGSSSSNEELRAFLKHVLPNYDEDKVYISDIKKIVSWYKIIYRELPDLFLADASEEQVENKEEETQS